MEITQNPASRRLLFSLLCVQKKLRNKTRMHVETLTSCTNEECTAQVMIEFAVQKSEISFLESSDLSISTKR